MGYSVMGRELAVGFSESGGRLLHELLATRVERLGDDEDVRAVSSHLRGPGLGSLDPPPDDLAPPARMRLLALAVERLLHDLVADTPDLDNVEGRLRWLARLLDLHEILRTAAPDLALGEPRPSLRPSEGIECELLRLRARIDRIASRRERDLQTELGLIDRALQLAFEAERTPAITSTIARLEEERRDLLALFDAEP